MKIKLNQTEAEISATTVAQLLAELGQDKPGIAVALNGQVVPKSQWLTTLLKADDSLDIFSVIAGG